MISYQNLISQKGSFLDPFLFGLKLQHVITLKGKHKRSYQQNE